MMSVPNGYIEDDTWDYERRFPEREDEQERRHENMGDLIELCGQYLDGQVDDEDFARQFAKLMVDNNVETEVAQFLSDNYPR